MRHFEQNGRAKNKFCRKTRVKRVKTRSKNKGIKVLITRPKPGETVEGHGKNQVISERAAIFVGQT